MAFENKKKQPEPDESFLADLTRFLDKMPCLCFNSLLLVKKWLSMLCEVRNSWSNLLMTVYGFDLYG